MCTGFDSCVLYVCRTHLLQDACEFSCSWAGTRMHLLCVSCASPTKHIHSGFSCKCCGNFEHVQNCQEKPQAALSDMESRTQHGFDAKSFSLGKSGSFTVNSQCLLKLKERISVNYWTTIVMEFHCNKNLTSCKVSELSLITTLQLIDQHNSVQRKTIQN